MIAGWLLDFRFSEKLKEEEKSIGISDLYEKIVYLTEKGLYGSYIMENYSKEEIVEAESYICKERNRLFNYSGLDLLIKRYVSQHIACSAGESAGDVLRDCPSSCDE